MVQKRRDPGHSRRGREKRGQVPFHGIRAREWIPVPVFRWLPRTSKCYPHLSHAQLIQKYLKTAGLNKSLGTAGERGFFISLTCKELYRLVTACEVILSEFKGKYTLELYNYYRE